MMRRLLPFATPPMGRIRAKGRAAEGGGVSHLAAMTRPILPLLLLLAAAPAMGHEVRLGLMGHDVGVFGGEKEDGVDVNVEVLFPSPPVLAFVAAPRPHLGLSVNLAGDTSQAYLGLTWEWQPWDDGWFIEGSLGGAVHNGELADPTWRRKDLGSRVLFRESVSIGYRWAGGHSVMVTLDHVSNANLASHNEGLDTMGVRWGYRF